MKRWGVTLPITGTIYVEVEAEDEESAITAALNSDFGEASEDMQWEAHEHVVQGNVFYGMQREAEAQEIE